MRTNSVLDATVISGLRFLTPKAQIHACILKEPDVHAPRCSVSTAAADHAGVQHMLWPSVRRRFVPVLYVGVNRRSAFDTGTQADNRISA